MYLLDLFGTAVFAVTGSLAAGRKQLDVFGVMVVAAVTAVGGGTIRDLILGIRPVFWVRDTNYVVLSVAAALVTFVVARYYKMPESLLLVFDAFGLAVFTVIGCEAAMRQSAPVLIAVITGTMTGSAGGMMRDVLCGEVPLILRKEIYATASLLGGVVFLLMSAMGFRFWMSGSAAGLVVLTTRLAAIRWGLSLPKFIARDR
jgi:uncharacterized membrane protein YeiH